MKSRSYQYLYDHRWRQARLSYLIRHPQCVMCQQAGRTRQATVVDHVVPHRGDRVLFWDIANWQGLCVSCHNSAKQRIEVRGYDVAIGPDGMPIDPDHPWNKNK